MSTEDFVERGLRSLGFEVCRLPERSTKTPDFLVNDSRWRYLIEVKDKFPDPAKEQLRRDTLAQGQVYDDHQPTGYRNNISDVVREAAEQLTALPADFRIIWLHARDRHPEVQLEQFRATLYGVAYIVDLEEERFSSRRCLYFNFSEFWSLQGAVDAAIISTDSEGQFCLNAFSERYRDLCRSSLCEAFGPGVFDPVAKAAAGELYVADCVVSRRDKAAVLKYVQRKYQRPKLIDLNMGHYTAEVVVPSTKSA